MPSVVKFPSAAAVTGFGDVNWSGLNNLFADDTAYAESYSFADSGNIVTDEIGVTGFGFAIPSTATINGILLTINRRATSLGNEACIDNIVQLCKASGIVGNNKASAVGYPTTLTDATYGSSTDLWGATWTPSEINDSAFGVRFQVLEITTMDAGVWPIVDFLKIEVFYTEAAGGSSTGRMFMMFE